VVTAVPSSFPLATRKLSAIGHGVDAGFFAPDPGVVPETPPSIVLVGRLMPIKHQATLVRAARRLGPPFDRARVILAGGIPPGAGADYASHLQEAVEALGLSSRVTFTGAIPPEEVRERYRRATVAVNLGPEGLFDKAAIESMMADTPTIVCSRAFDDLLGEHAPVLRIVGPEDDPGLAAALTRVLAMSSGSRRAMAAGVAARARAAHGLQGMMDRFVALLRGLADAA
jgi:glycosyltransferase involved in cell wall biosynthesis